MQTVKTKIGNTEVLIQSVDGLPSAYEAQSAPTAEDPWKNASTTSFTNVANGMSSAFEKAKNVIFELVEECEAELDKRLKKPDEFSLEFSLSFSGKSDLWIIGCENNAAMKVTMKWQCR